MPQMPKMGADILFASLSLNILSVALPVVILQTYDRVLPNAALETLAMLVLGLAVVVVLDAALRLGRNQLTMWAAVRFEHVAGCRAVDRLLGAGIDRLEEQPPGVHLDRLVAIETLRDFYSGQAKLLMVDLPFVTIFLALIFVIAGELVIVPVCMLAVLVAGSLLIGRGLRQSLEQRAGLDDRRYSFILEVLGAIHTIKSLGFEAAMQRRYERLQETGATLSYRLTLLNNLSQNFGQVLTYGTMIAVATYGATLVMANELTIGGLAAATLLAGRTVQPLLRALSFWAQFQNIVVARERANALFAIRPETPADAPECPELAGAIELADVAFAYRPDAPPILEHVDLRVQLGEVIGIRGAMGCGKTTLMMVLMGVLKPTAGKVYFDGWDLSNCEPNSLRSQIAFMPQSAILFQGTILENLTMYRVASREARAIQVCKDLGIDAVINRLPAGYETVVGAGAENELSIGLRQGIAMARALIAAPKIVLFDEANAAVDAKTDARLKNALAAIKGRTTMVLVSHRPSLLALADRLYAIENRRLVELPHVPAPAPARRDEAVEGQPSGTDAAPRTGSDRE